MNQRFYIVATVCAMLATAPAQVASHAPTPLKTMVPGASTAPGANKFVPGSSLLVTGKPVVSVNGVVLTDRDLLREMYQLFPYARVHNNGFPKAEEESIRSGALEMIEYEELVYQDAQHRKMSIPAARLNQALGQFRSKFQSEEEYKAFLKVENGGSEQLLLQQIRRSLLIDAFLHAELDIKSKVSPLEARQYYVNNPKQFQHGEMFGFQSISIMPAETASADVKAKAHKRAEDALRQAKAAKNYQEFGLLAEKLSEDDFHVNMGDHKWVAKADLPPELLKAFATMKPGDVTNLIQIGSFYTVARLRAHVPAGKVKFDDVKGKLISDLHKSKYDRLRHELNTRLRLHAKIVQL